MSVVQSVQTTVAKARVNGHVENINNPLTSRIDDLKKEKAPYHEKEKMIAKGEVPLFNADGSAQLNEDKTHKTQPLTEEEKAKLQAEITAFAARQKEIDEEISLLKAPQTRFADSFLQGITHLLDSVILELVMTGIQHAKANDKKTAKVGHLSDEACRGLRCYRLVKSLPSWPPVEPVKPEKATGEEAKKEAPAAEKHTEKTFDYYIGEIANEYTHPAVRDAAGNPTKQKVVRDKKTKENGVEKTVQHEVEEIVRKKDGPYNDIKISAEIKSYISSLVCELIKRFMNLTKQLLTTAKSKTASKDILLCCLRMMLSDGVSYTETLESYTKTVVEPNFAKAEKAKRKEQGGKYIPPADSAVPKVTEKHYRVVTKYDDPAVESLVADVAAYLVRWEAHEKQKDLEREERRKKELAANPNAPKKSFGGRKPATTSS